MGVNSMYIHDFGFAWEIDLTGMAIGSLENVLFLLFDSCSCKAGSSLAAGILVE